MKNFIQVLKKISADNKCLCKKCTKSISSYERKIIEFLDKNKIKYIPQKTFMDCKNKRKLYFDFFIPERNLLIEMQGELHCENIRIKNNFFGGFKGVGEQTKNDLIKKKIL